MPLRITDEIKQTRPFASKSAEAAVALMRTADLVRRAIGGVVENAGITLQQYNVLRILRGSGPKGLPTLEIAERMIEQAPGITRLIDRLEAKHLVARERCSTDRRQVFCCITTEGLGLLDSLNEPMRSVEASALGTLCEEHVSQLLGILDTTREAIHAAMTTSPQANHQPRSSHR
ncbi:MAG TPA: MarR family transcriptional regulator [Thermoanaerobaculia bacterium]|nr:MarR family transcriptional regulator [Thermoanaerobaculia bacterium]